MKHLLAFFMAFSLLLASVPLTHRPGRLQFAALVWQLPQQQLAELPQLLP